MERPRCRLRVRLEIIEVTGKSCHPSPDSYVEFMRRALFLSFGWALAIIGLYASLVLLELRWNLFDWEPRLDLKAVMLVLGSFVAIALLWFLARAGGDRVTQVLSLICVLAILGVAIYVSAAEPLSQGLFARSRPSPLWYRGGRFILMLLPSIFWAVGLLRQRKSMAHISCTAGLAC